MYHYVRELKGSRFSEIKALTVERFIGQLEYIERYHTVVSASDVVASLKADRDELPANAALLTFDDGYRDHYENVLPILLGRGMSGIFFPPAEAVTNHKVLDVNKIHFLLASVLDKSRILIFIASEINRWRDEFDLESPDDYFRTWGKKSRWDPPEVVYIKNMLQKVLPEPLRQRIVDDLFREFVSADEADFSSNLYMSVGELQQMLSVGMEIGSHGFQHRWLDACSDAEQELEIDRSLVFLADLGVPPEDWMIAYPYGAADGRIIDLVARRGCSVGLTTRVAVADLDSDPPLLLPRLDTNDLPQGSHALSCNKLPRVSTVAGPITADGEK